MHRKIVFLGIMCMAFLVGMSSCFAASTFQKIFEAKYMTESLGRDEAWTKSFNTRDGEIKFQMRKIAMESDDKRFNLIVKCGKDTVYKRHFPKVDGGYSFMAMKDTSNSRLFFVLQSKKEAYLYGYESINNKFEVYIDSQNYLNKYHGEPKIAVLRDGSLVLAFEPAYSSNASQNQRYSFSWNDDKLWFSYRDLGTGYGSVAREEI